MGPGTSGGRTLRRRVRVELTVEALPECTGLLEAGLQTGSEAIDGGAALPDGAIRYLTDITAQWRGDGSVSWSGAAVQGTGGDRFLYVSFRSPGSRRDWERRFKVALPHGLRESTVVLCARVRDTGGTRPTFVGHGWEEQ